MEPYDYPKLITTPIQNFRDDHDDASRQFSHHHIESLSMAFESDIGFPSACKLLK